MEAFARTPLLWPVAPLDGPHEVAGTFGEVRGEAGQERFHAGLDVRENQGTSVRAVRDGIVASPIATTAFETLNESLRIGPLTYVHIRAGRRKRTRVGEPGTAYRVPGTGNSDAAAARTRSRTGLRALGTRRPNSVGVGAGLPPPPFGYGGQVVRHEPADVDLQRFAPVYDAEGVMIACVPSGGLFFTTGDEVGTVNAFNHVHLNVGWSGEEYNPLRFRLVQFADGIAPSIAAAGVRLFDEAWSPLNPDRPGPMRGRGRKRRPTRLPPLEPVVVRGRVRIVVDAWDQADGNKAYRRLGLYAIGYTVIAKASADRTPNAERRTPSPRPCLTECRTLNAERRLCGTHAVRRLADGECAAGDAGVRPHAARSRCRKARVRDRQRHPGVRREPHAVPVRRDDVVSRRHRDRGVLGYDDSDAGRARVAGVRAGLHGNPTSRDLRVVVVP